MTFDLEKDEKLSWKWRFGTIMTMIIGFGILATVTTIAYDNIPPVPDKVLDSSGNVLFTGKQIMKGQEVFLKKNLMEHGTLWGMELISGLITAPLTCTRKLFPCRIHYPIPTKESLLKS
jgi:hypothetical protein